MAESTDTEKTEPASPHKRGKAREQGNVALSRELPSVAVLGVALLVFSMGASWYWDHLVDLFKTPLRLIGQVDLTTETVWPLAKFVAWKMAVFFFPLVTAVIVAGVGSYVGQIGFLYAGEAIAFKFERLSPISGFKNMFSLRAAIEAIKCVLKIAIVASVVWMLIKGELNNLADLAHMPPWTIFGYLMGLMYRILFRTLIVLLFLAVLDYAYQRFDWEKKLRMTHEEVKEEYKHLEGDPKVKARIRSVQREISMRRMMSAVPKADVVITNPTEIAVALQYQAPRDPAPRVTAKGRGVIAEKIREVAVAHGVPILERRDLARELFRTVKLNHLIPVALYHAVAEILAYVYNLRERRTG
jgi:flagellar biosynthetic protein FlhB